MNTLEKVTVTYPAALAALTVAKALNPAPARASGCGRIYVSVYGLDRRGVNAVAKAAAAVGMIFQRKAYYNLSNALYVGYDNATGREMAKGEAMADALKAAGIPAYMSAEGD